MYAVLFFFKKNILKKHMKQWEHPTALAANQNCKSAKQLDWKIILVIIIFYWNKISLKFLTFYKDIFPCQNELLKTQCKFHTKVLATYNKKYTLLKYHNLIATVSFKLDVAKLQLFK